MGITDIPLDSCGIKQAERARAALQDIPVRTICSGPLRRTRQTAEILNREMKCEMILIEELKEFCIGTYAGKVVGDWFNDWINGALLPEAESYREFVKRALYGVNRALAYPGPVLIVGHGGTYWAIREATRLTDLPDLPHCTLIHFSPSKSPKEGWKCSEYFPHI